jgi:hypothetical protein
MAIAMAPTRVAFALARWSRPNREPVSARAIQVPVQRSMFRNKTPRKTNSSVTAAPVMMPSRATALAGEPRPLIV